MPFIGTRFRDDVHRSSGVATLVGSKHVGLNFELTDRFNGGSKNNGKREPLVVVYAIEEKVIGTFAISIREYFATRTKIVRACTAHDGALRAEADTGHAWSKGGQLHEVTTVERQISNGSGFNNLTNGGVTFFKQWNGGSHFNSFGDLTHFKLHINACRLIYFQMNVVLKRGLEARFLHAHFVATGLEQRQRIQTAVIGISFPRHKRVQVLHRNSSGSNGSTSLITDGAGKGGKVLGEGCVWGKDTERYQCQGTEGGAREDVFHGVNLIT